LTTKEKGADVQIIAGSLSKVTADDGTVFTPKHSLTSTASVCLDALYLCRGKESAGILMNMVVKSAILHNADKVT